MNATPEEILRAFGQFVQGTTSGTSRPFYGGPFYKGPQPPDPRVPVGQGVHGEPIYYAEVISITNERESK